MGKPTVTVTIQGVGHKVDLPEESQTWIEIPGVNPCPGCKCPGLLRVSGAGRRIDGYDTYAADAVTTCCKGWVGTIRVQVHDTLFGIAEDERVLRMGVTIY